jgi:hypothetical protein
LASIGSLNRQISGSGPKVTTLKEFEDALREQGMHMALAVLEKLRERDRAKRSIAPARRIAGRKMTPELARKILEMHANTEMTQQEIAFELGVNQGRVNEVIKRGKWLSGDPEAPEAVARDRAKARMGRLDPRKSSGRRQANSSTSSAEKKRKGRSRTDQTQFVFGDL